MEDNVSPVDSSVLAQICGGDTAFERKVLGNFRHSVAGDATKLRAAVASGDCLQVKCVSHSIRGASRTIGAGVLADLAERIEHASRAEQWSAVVASMPAFDRELDRVDAYVRSCLESKPLDRTNRERDIG